MAVKPVLRMGDPRLRRVSEPVRAFGTPELRTLIADLLDTMRANDGVGIAAPQIGVALRVVIFGFAHNPRYPDAPAVPMTVLVNPRIEVLDAGRQEGWEGCLSVPGMRGLVSRWQRLRYQGFDAEGGLVLREVDGFHARVVQHECDHLDGILYPERMGDLRHFGYADVLEASGVLGRHPVDPD